MSHPDSQYSIDLGETFIKRSLLRSFQSAFVHSFLPESPTIQTPTNSDGNSCAAPKFEARHATRACTHKSSSRVRFRATQTLSRLRRMTEFDPIRNSCSRDSPLGVSGIIQLTVASREAALHI